MPSLTFRYVCEAPAAESCANVSAPFSAMRGRRPSKPRAALFDGRSPPSSHPPVVSHRPWRVRTVGTTLQQRAVTAPLLPPQAPPAAVIANERVSLDALLRASRRLGLLVSSLLRTGATLCG